METPAGSGKLRRFVVWMRRQRASGRLSPIVPVFLFVLTWVAFSGPVVYWDLLFPALIGWFALALTWFLLLVARLIRWRYRHGLFDWRPWLYVPAFLVVTVIACWARAPFWLGYLTSRPEMDNVAHDVMAGKRDPGKIRWIGIYPVVSAWKSDNGFVFYVNYTSTYDWNPSFDTWGFLYSATNPPNPKATDYGYCENVPLHYLTGRWYKLQMAGCGA